MASQGLTRCLPGQRLDWQLPAHKKCQAWWHCLSTQETMTIPKFLHKFHVLYMGPVSCGSWIAKPWTKIWSAEIPGTETWDFHKSVALTVPLVLPSAGWCKATHGHHGPILSALSDFRNVTRTLSAFLDTWLVVEIHKSWQSIVAEKDDKSICEFTGKA